RRRRWFGFHAEHALEEISMALGCLLAGLSRLRAVNEGGDVVVRAGGRGDLIGRLVERELDNALRRRERSRVRVFGKRNRTLHEFSPDGQGQSGARELDEYSDA